MEFKKSCSVLKKNTTALQLYAVHTIFSQPTPPHNFQHIMPWPVLETSNNQVTKQGYC
jgi:hypothetical protein